MVIDHINDDKTDNRLCNLQELTPGDNIWKGRPHFRYLRKCNLNKPRSYYEDKLAEYLEEYERSKPLKDRYYTKKLRCNISTYRAYIRYWDLHHMEQ